MKKKCHFATCCHPGTDQGLKPGDTAVFDFGAIKCRALEHWFASWNPKTKKLRQFNVGLFTIAIREKIQYPEFGDHIAHTTGLPDFKSLQEWILDKYGELINCKDNGTGKKTTIYFASGYIVHYGFDTVFCTRQAKFDEGYTGPIDRYLPDWAIYDSLFQHPKFRNYDHWLPGEKETFADLAIELGYVSKEVVQVKPEIKSNPVQSADQLSLF